MIVNGKLVSEKAGFTLEEYLQKEGYVLTTIVIELNGKIIPKEAYGKVVLSEEDKMEIVHFVGGG